MINTLTSLRFLFALMVFGAHCYVLSPFFDTHVFKEGFVGVSFFFVLSGFIIAYNYQDKLHRKEINKRTFWIARIARIYPLHWLTLLTAALLGYTATTGTADWLRHFLPALTLTHAYIPQTDYFFSFNSPSWSLCCEQLFYLCFPFLVPFIGNGKRLLMAVGIIALLVITGMYLTPEESIKGYWYVNPLARFPDFIVGVLLYKAYTHIKDRSISFRTGSLLEIGVLALFLVFYLYAADVPKVYRYSCYYWLPVSAVLLCFSLQKGIVSRLLSNRLLIIGGEISYSFYLIHLFVLLTYTERQKTGALPSIDWPIAVPVLFCIVIALCLLSYYYFEKPMNKYIKELLNN